MEEEVLYEAYWGTHNRMIASGWCEVSPGMYQLTEEGAKEVGRRHLESRDEIRAELQKIMLELEEQNV